MNRMAAVAAVLAAGLFLLVLAGFGAAYEGYSHALHPPALLGAHGIDHAHAFNLLGYIVPGLLAVLVAMGLRAQLDRSTWMARIGPSLWMLSAFAFAVQGMLPLDPSDLDAQASRLHAAAWTVWWIAFVPGAALLAAGLGREARWRVLRRVAAVAAVLLPLFALVAPLGMPAGVAQRMALAVWFASLLAAGFGTRSGYQP